MVKTEQVARRFLASFQLLMLTSRLVTAQSYFALFLSRILLLYSTYVTLGGVSHSDNVNFDSLKLFGIGS